MINSPINTQPYNLLATFLAPDKTEQQIAELQALIGQDKINWGLVLLQANIDFCTPLWYVQLKMDNLFYLVPQDLQEYLTVIYDANCERNQLFREELEKVLIFCEAEQIQTILLKGAATFYDNLYGDDGARVMKDLDLLIKPEQIDAVVSYLVASNYQVIPNPRRTVENKQTDLRHHHIDAYQKRGTPVVIEIHYNTLYAETGQILPPEDAWNRSISCVDHYPLCNILSPSDRLLHHALHASNSQREFIQGNISLLYLTEYQYLKKKYCLTFEDITKGKNPIIRHYLTPLRTFDYLAQILFSEISSYAEVPLRAKLHGKRVLAWQNSSLALHEENHSFSATLTNALLHSYFLSQIPMWMWRNTCYAAGFSSIPDRIRMCIKKLFTAESYKKI
ncbi:MAG: hypothetical protein C0631_03990 [Sedimenticola sp.]|nr:MAG: hypothetical protein C0631_03990 [Sedimenticola sp.]